MAAVGAAGDLLDVTTTDALQEKKKLRKHFARFDILFFLTQCSQFFFQKS